jgi:hypothetical protein
MGGISIAEEEDLEDLWGSHHQYGEADTVILIWRHGKRQFLEIAIRQLYI